MTTRIQTNVVALAERALLTKLCRVMPLWVTPDLLTLLGLAGAGVVFAGYALSNFSLYFLGLSIFGYILHWFGDSMDGSLARYRHIERPRYGFFVDHSTDALGNMLIASGIGLTAAVRMDAALFAFIGYLLLSIYVFLKRQVLDEFQLSFVALGPTEIRIILIAITLCMPWLGGIHFFYADVRLSACDVVVLFGGAILYSLFLWSVWQTAGQLRREEAGR